MIDYDRDQIEQDMESDTQESHQAEDDSRDAGGPGRAAPARKEVSRRQAELPSPMYRLRILHSNETFFGYFLFGAEGERPHFRSMEALAEALEGPVHSAGGIESMGAAQADSTMDAPPPPLEAGSSETPEAPVSAVPSEATDPADAVETAEAAEAIEAAETVGESSAPEQPGPAAKATPAIPSGSIVVAQTRYGRDLCEVQGVALDVSVVNPDEVVAIEKAASLEEYRKHRSNLEKEEKAYELCRQKIWSRNLPMKLVSAHYMLDEPKILFYFSAEARVDFRELVKDLVSVFKMRIELRQIGVRDEARVTGGCGVCGRILCCNGVSDKLNPVSIKMAKDQNLSLNSLKISGPCGRLLCCLSYEYQFYRDMRRELPPEGARFLHDGTQFRVVEVSPLTGSVKMAGEDGRLLDMKSDMFRLSEGRWHIRE